MNDELGEFVTQLMEWHEAKVSNLRDIAQMTGAFTLKVGEDGQTVELNDREALFFRTGIETALLELGKLPFSVSRTDADEDD